MTMIPTTSTIALQILRRQICHLATGIRQPGSYKRKQLPAPHGQRLEQ